MKRIMLLCSAGMSTSMLIVKMQDHADEKKLDLVIFAASEAEAKSHYDNVDAIMLGPQVKYLFEKLKKMMEPKGVPVQVIDSISYGTINAEAVLQQALTMIEPA